MTANPIVHVYTQEPMRADGRGHYEVDQYCIIMMMMIKVIHKIVLQAITIIQGK